MGTPIAGRLDVSRCRRLDSSRHGYGPPAATAHGLSAHPVRLDAPRPQRRLPRRRGLGCREVQFLASGTHPVVWGVGPEVPGAPTLLLYGHYDVQPPDPLDEWTTPPFQPSVRDGRLFARGAADDKGQVFCLLKAIEA